MTLAIMLNTLKRIIYKLVKGESLDEKQQRMVDKIIADMDKKSTPSN